MDKRRVIIRALAVCAALCTVGGCRSDALVSVRVAGEAPAIDGDNAEWTDPFTAVADDKADVAVRNDDGDLYLCLRIYDEGLRRRAAAGGLTVWFDRTGGEKKTFGVLYPYREKREEPVNPGVGPRREPPADTVAPPPVADEPGTMRLLAPGRTKPLTMPSAGAGKVTVASYGDDAVTVYELKVPLGVTGNGPFSVCADSAGTIGVGFEVSAPGKPGGARGPAQGRGGPGGGRPPQGGGMGMGGPPMRGGGPGGPPPGGGAPGGDAAEKTEYWITVKLAG